MAICHSDQLRALHASVLADFGGVVPCRHPPLALVPTFPSPSTPVTAPKPGGLWTERVRASALPDQLWSQETTSSLHSLSALTWLLAETRGVLRTRSYLGPGTTDPMPMTLLTAVGFLSLPVTWRVVSAATAPASPTTISQLPKSRLVGQGPVP